MSLVRCLTVMGITVLLGCGGAPGSGVATETAPLSVTELDLPGCDCPGAFGQGDTVTLMRHPHDAGLIVALVEGRGPTCIDSPRAAIEAMDASAAHLAPTFGGTTNGFAALSESLPEDDPVPIREAEEEGNGNNDGQDDNGGANNQGTDNDGTGGNPGDVIKVSLNQDDPVPIRDRQPLVEGVMTRTN